MTQVEYKDIYPGQIHFWKQDHIAYLKFDNPANLNAFSFTMFASINEIFDKMLEDRDILGVILTGEGRSFIVGADLKELDDMRNGDTYAYYYPKAYRDQRVYIHDTLNKIAKFPHPTLCAINGYALGGGAEVALNCDVRIASRTAKIGFPETSIGGIAAFTGISRSIRSLGIATAKEIHMTARHYTAEEALRRGFVCEVYESEELMDKAIEMIKLITFRSPVCEKYLKLFPDTSAEMSYEASLEYERNMVSLTQYHPDAQESTDAFKQKRPPKWRME